MATYTELTLEQAEALGALFGVRTRAVAPVPAGSVNSNYRLELDGGAALFARVYEEQDQQGAEGEARLLAHFSEHGVSTPRPLSRVDGGGFTVVIDGRVGPRPLALFPW